MANIFSTKAAIWPRLVESDGQYRVPPQPTAMPSAASCSIQSYCSPNVFTRNTAICPRVFAFCGQ
jgi:hypothetical protein